MRAARKYADLSMTASCTDTPDIRPREGVSA
jgi:hypothetical protein